MNEQKPQEKQDVCLHRNYVPAGSIAIVHGKLDLLIKSMYVVFCLDCGHYVNTLDGSSLDNTGLAHMSRGVVYNGEVKYENGGWPKPQDKLTGADLERVARALTGALGLFVANNDVLDEGQGDPVYAGDGAAARYYFEIREALRILRTAGVRDPMTAPSVRGDANNPIHHERALGLSGDRSDAEVESVS